MINKRGEGVGIIFRWCKQIVLLMLIILLLLTTNVSQANSTNSLFVYCAAGLRKPMQKIGRQFEVEYGTKINYQFNGSGVLFNQIKTVKTGDLYIPSDDWYIEKLKQVKGKGKQTSYICKHELVAYHTPVVITPINNPANVQEFDDLDSEGIEAVLGSKSTAIGRVTDEILTKSKVCVSPVAKMGTVNQVAMAIAMGQGNAGLIWRANYQEFNNQLQMVKIPPKFNIIKELSISVLNSSQKRSKAVQFMNFVASDKGKDIFAEYGYKVVSKDE